MKVLVSGSSGLIGRSLCVFLASKNYNVFRLVRFSNHITDNTIFWYPEYGILDESYLEGFDVIIHLAGEPIASGRWTAKKKRAIYNSRVNSTKLLVEKITNLSTLPKVFICASAIGYYGDRNDEILTEESSYGSSFLAKTAYDWEEATKPLIDMSVKVVNLRIGIVLSANGGAFPKILIPFKLGLGGVLGSGKQYWSWISIDDLIYIIYESIVNNNLFGPVNAVSTASVTNYEFTKILGRILKRPTILPMPTFMVRFIFGEMADELFLASTRVQPKKLLSLSYKFHHTDLENTLKYILGIS